MTEDFDKVLHDALLEGAPRVNAFLRSEGIEPKPAPIADIQEFRTKWGTLGPGLLVGKFIEMAPEFEGESELAKMIGEMMGDLQFALEHLKA